MATRREFLKHTALLGAALGGPVAAGACGESSLARPDGTAEQIAGDEAFWARVAAQYRVTDAITNFEAGYFGLMATPVLKAYHRHIDRTNRDNSYFARREYPALAEQVRAKVATFIGTPPETITFSRNATEALQALIGQYNRLRPGDAIVYADLDYPAMQQSMNTLAARTGARLVTFDIPEPASRQGVLDAYAEVLQANPATRLLLLTHCNNKTGLLLPVKEIAALARPRGIDIVCDAAHSFGQVPLTIADLDADFVGLNLHKWIGAPLGAGVMYIRPEKLAAIDRVDGDPRFLDKIESRLHTGTTNFATMLTVADALDFQATIGIDRKAARLRYLRDRWVAGVRNVAGITVLTPDEPGLVGAITGFRVKDQGTREANQAIVRTLHDEYRLFTQWRTGLAKGDCVRVTPALYNSAADADRLAAAVRTIASR